MRQLDRISRRRRRSDGGAKAKNEPTTDELLKSVCRRLDRRTDEDDDAAYEDAPSTTPSVGQETAEGEGGNLTEIVGDEDDARRGTGAVEAE